jgi:rhamnosyltransferase
MTRPKVTVLMATFNGIAWLPDQLYSILNQIDVDVSIIISDDKSSDASYEYVKRIAQSDNRLKILQQNQKFGSAGKNFYRLVADADIADCDYVAFADQDDIWLNDKLIRHIRLAKQYGADGVSSNVMAFWENGNERLIDKAQPQRELDYLFESAGPGCTFLLTPWLVNKVREQVLDSNSTAREVTLHDWLTYAICRAHGRRWVIDRQPSLLYRQHKNNAIGANIGLRAKWERLRKIKQHWYRNEVLKVAEVSQRISSNANVTQLIQLLQINSFFGHLKLLKFISQVRRRVLDRAALACAILAGLF